MEDILKQFESMPLEGQVQLALAVLSGLAAIVTILFTDYGALKGRYRANWAHLARSIFSFLALALFFTFSTVLLSKDSAILLRWSSYAYMFLAAFTYFGAGIVIWAGFFNRFQHLVFYSLVSFNIVYSCLLKQFSDQPSPVATEVVGFYGIAVLGQILLAAERFAYSRVGYPFQGLVEKFRKSVRSKSMDSAFGDMDELAREDGEPRKADERNHDEPESTSPRVRGHEPVEEQGGAAVSWIPEESETATRQHQGELAVSTSTAMSAAARRLPRVSIDWSRAYGEVESWTRFLVYSFFGATTYSVLMLIGSR